MAKNPTAILTTFLNETDAEAMAQILLEKKLSACIQMMSPIKSFYVWKEKVQKENEILLLIKTDHALFDEITKIMKEHHPYDTPQIISIPFLKLEKEYENWFYGALK